MAHGPVHGEQDVNKLLSTLTVHQDPTTYVYLSFTGSPPKALDDMPVVMHLVEPRFDVRADRLSLDVRPSTSTTTIIATQADAEQHGLQYEYPCKRLTLAVQSSLAAVGFMAVVGKALADEGISVNTVAGYWHDHLFVDVEKADNAVRVIEGVREGAATSSPSTAASSRAS